MARRKGSFAWSPVRRLMTTNGADIVSRAAVRSLLDYLEARARKITEAAVEFAKNANRKKVSKADLALAIETI